MTQKIDKELSKSREVMFRSWVKESSKLKTPLNKLANELISEVEKSIDEENRQIIPKKSAEIRKRFDKKYKAQFKELIFEIEWGILRAIKRAHRAQIEQIVRLGIPKISTKEKIDIQENALQGLYREFPTGSKKNFYSRMKGIERTHSIQLNRILQTTSIQGKALEKISRDIKAGLITTGNGITPIRGGSLLKKLRRIMVGEQTRLSNEVSLQTLKASGIDFAYWRNSILHKNNNESICEQYATGINIETVDLLKSKGIVLKNSDLKGLFSIEKWPSLPYPHCKCYPEGWVQSK